jgi:3D (Asp-Asp-Asp) domain-containing protein
MKTIILAIVLGGLFILTTGLYCENQYLKESVEPLEPIIFDAKKGCIETYNEYWHVSFNYIDAEVTAYCPCQKCCRKFSDGVTASGLPVDGIFKRFVAAPPEYEFGTIVIIPGYGAVPVLDRGGAIQGNKFDVFFPDHNEALNWGRKNMIIWIEEKAENTSPSSDSLASGRGFEN